MDKFSKYLNDLEITTILRKRIEEIFNFHQDVIGLKIKDIFITDYLKEDSSRVFESLWFFTDKFAIEAKEFITKDDFDCTPICNKIHYWTIEKQDYDFKSASTKSRFNLGFTLFSRVKGHLKASQKNCDYLKDIFNEYVKVNLIESL